MNNYWALRREITQNNGSSRPVQPDSQTRNNHQSANAYLTTPHTMPQRPQNYHLMGVNNQSTNGFTHHVQHDGQAYSNHQSTNGYLTTPQTRLQGPQNHLMGVNNFNQERYQSNNSVDAATFPFSANDTTSFMTATRYGRALPLGSGLTSSHQQHRALPLGSSLTSSHQQHRALPLGSGLASSPQQHMSSPNTALLFSYDENLARNFSSNVVGSQGSANWSRNPSRPIFQNQRNSRYFPYGDGSNRRNNSISSNDFNLRPSGNTNRFHSVNDSPIPSATPPPFRPINGNDLSMFLSSINTNGDSTRNTSMSHRVFDIQDNEARNISTPPPFFPINNNDFNPRASVDTNRFHVNDGSIPIITPPFCPVNTEDTSLFLSSGNNNLDSAHETSTSHRVFDIRDTAVGRRTMTPPDNSFEAIQTEMKELLLFKDTIPTSSVSKAGDANENDDERLDLSLRL